MANGKLRLSMQVKSIFSLWLFQTQIETFYGQSFYFSSQGSKFVIIDFKIWAHYLSEPCFRFGLVHLPLHHEHSEYNYFEFFFIMSLLKTIIDRKWGMCELEHQTWHLLIRYNIYLNENQLSLGCWLVDMALIDNSGISLISIIEWLYYDSQTINQVLI